jgi:DNA-damage-inducible protein D
MIDMPKGATRDIEDMILSRYACYSIVQNGDSRKKVIALGQTYFVVKTKQQELIDDYNYLTYDQKRLAIRNEMINHNKSLAEAADMAGVKTSFEYAAFQNHGYMVLYGGLKARDIHEKKRLKKSQKMLDIWRVLN